MKYRIRFYQGVYWIERAWMGLWFWPFRGLYEHHSKGWEHSCVDSIGYRYPSLSAYATKDKAVEQVRRFVTKSETEDTYIYVDVR